MENDIGEYEEVEEGNDGSVELVDEDQGEHLLCIVQKILLTTRSNHSGQRHSIFLTKCTINKRVCDVIIDGGNSENIVSKALVKTLGLTTLKHLNPYSVGWIKRGSETKVSELCKVPFSIGKWYLDELACDVIDMNFCHLIVGCPWQFDNSMTHDGRNNTYSFQWKEKTMVLLPSKTPPVLAFHNPDNLHTPTVSSKPSPTPLLLTISGHKFLNETKNTHQLFAIVAVAHPRPTTIDSPLLPPSILKLLTKYKSIAPQDLPDHLPPLRDIQHQIDFFLEPLFLTFPTIG